MTATPETHPTIADRYTHLIYAAALRQTKDPHLAADITQAVFLVLLKKTQSGKAPEEQRMTGWLLQVTHYIIKETRRASFRRHHRERAIPTPTHTTPSNHPEITDLLDTALLTLHPTDRELIARRYLHEEPLESLAATLHLSPNTTTKRLTRALEKLRTSLGKNGIAAPTTLLTATLATQATIKSPTAAAMTTATPLAHDFARRLLWHSLVIKTVTITAIAALFCLITTITAFLAFHASAPAETAASTPPAPATASQPAEEHLIHLGKILEPSSDHLIAQILAGIEQNRAKLKTLEIESTATVSWRFGNDPTFLDSQTTGKAWFDAGNPQRFRFEVSLQRSPWIDGAAPYLEDSYTETWDGTALRILHQPPHSILRAEVAEREDYADGTAILGRNYSMQLAQLIGSGAGAREVNENPLDTTILNSLRLSARRVILNDVETLELETHFRLPPTLSAERRLQLEHFARRYWFDPARGFALLAKDEGLDNAPPTDEVVIDELAQPAPGIFYPARARSIGYSRDRATNSWQLQDRSEFHATRITANQPLDPTLFRLDFPPNISISHRGPSATSQPASRP